MEVYAKIISSLIIYVCLVQLAWCVSKEKRAWYEHMERVDKFNCSLPQPTCLKSKDILREHLMDPLATIFPSRTVLYRCNNDVGYLPLKFQQVSLTFRIIEKNGKTSIRETFKTVTAQNHTECFPSNSNDPK